VTGEIPQWRKIAHRKEFPIQSPTGKNSQFNSQPERIPNSIPNRKEFPIQSPTGKNSQFNPQPERIPNSIIKTNVKWNTKFKKMFKFQLIYISRLFNGNLGNSL
jgi:hypothetical protein